MKSHELHGVLTNNGTACSSSSSQQQDVIKNAVQIKKLACNRYSQYWITNTKQACMGSDAICVPYLLLLLPSGFDLITEPEVLIGVWPKAHPVCDRAALSVDRVDREITLTQPPLRAPKPGITSQPQPASQLNIGTQLTSREQTWHQSHAVAWLLNFTS